MTPSRPGHVGPFVGMVFLTTACTGTVDTSGGSGHTVAPLCTEHGSAGPAPIRRLSNREYVKTVRSLLGVDASDLAAKFPEDSPVDGFDNNVVAQDLSTNRVFQYDAAAEAIANRVVTNTTLRAQVVGCDPKTDTTCIRTFIRNFGRRAYRRALTADEETRLAQLSDTGFQQEGTDNAKIAYVLQGVLLSPKFLLRPETGTSVPDSHGRVRLSGYEMATRLSYLLWGSAPDDALLSAAESGELDTDEGVRVRADQMLADDRAKEGMHAFYEQWLRTESLSTYKPDATTFPEFTSELGSAMRTEVQLLVDRALWTPGANFMELFHTPRTYVNATLASFYGVAAPSGGGFSETTLPPSSGRAGLLTTAALLTVTSKPNKTSIMKRGRFVREVILCDPITLPAGFMVTPLTIKPGQTEAEALEMHASASPCIDCHRKMDPIGKGLEQFSAIGELRTTDDIGRTVTGAGFIDGFDNPNFTGGIELGQHVYGYNRTAQCVVEQVMRFAAARSVTPAEAGSADACTAEVIYNAFSTHNFSFQELIRAFIQSDAFRYRQYDAP